MRLRSESMMSFDAACAVDGVTVRAEEESGLEEEEEEEKEEEEEEEVVLTEEKRRLLIELTRASLGSSRGSTEVTRPCLQGCP